MRTEFGFTGNFADVTSLEASAGFRDTHAFTGSTRLMWEGSAEALSFEFHALAQRVHRQPGRRRGRAVRDGSAADPVRSRPHLERSTPKPVATGTIDRASVTFTTDNLVLRAGRQAITWGSGMVFHPSDIVAPFAPDAIDTTYKPGVDMLYGQYLFDNGADIQAIVVPRAATWGGDGRRSTKAPWRCAPAPVSARSTAARCSPTTAATMLAVSG